MQSLYTIAAQQSPPFTTQSLYRVSYKALIASSDTFCPVKKGSDGCQRSRLANGYLDRGAHVYITATSYCLLPDTDLFLSYVRVTVASKRVELRLTKRQVAGSSASWRLKEGKCLR